MKKFKLIVPSFVALIFCMLLIAGSTFALFTSQAEASIAVTSGKVDVDASLEKVALSHAVEDINGTLVDENGAHYSRSTDGKLWYADALTTVSASSIKLDRMVPGDRAEYKLNIANGSNVNIKYRVTLTADQTVLAQGMNVTVGSTLKAGLVKWQSEWMLAEATAAIPSVSLVFELPIDSGNKYQDSSVTYSFLVEAVQGNAATTGEEVWETLDAAVVYEPVSEQVTVTAATAENPVEINATAQSAEENSTDEVDFTVTVPASMVQANDVVEVKVEKLGVASNNDDHTDALSFDLSLLINEQPVTNNNTPITVKVFVGTDLQITSVIHNGEEITNYTYSNGYIQFDTTHFSPFEVKYIKSYTEGNFKYLEPSEGGLILLGAVDETLLANTDLVIKEGVTEVAAYAFDNVALKSIKCPSTLKKIDDYAFMSDSSTYATGSTINVELNEGLEEIGYRAFKAQPIKTLVLPSTIKVLNGCFYQCSELTEVVVPSGVTELNQSFGYCPKITSVILHEGLVNLGQDALRETAISTLVLPSTVTTIGTQALRQCMNLNLITIKGAVAPTFANNTFTNCYHTITLLFENATACDQFLAANDMTEGQPKVLFGTSIVAVKSVNVLVTKGDTVKFANTIAEAIQIADAGSTITLNQDEDVSAMMSINKSLIIDGNGHKLTITNNVTCFNVSGSGINSVFSNLHIDDANDGIEFTLRDNSSIEVNNCIFTNCFKAIHFNDSRNTSVELNNVSSTSIYPFNGNGGSFTSFVANNCTFNGWTSFGTEIPDYFVFNNCNFGKGSGYATFKPYQSSILNNCTFTADYFEELGGGIASGTNTPITIKFNNCNVIEKNTTFALNAETLKQMFNYDITSDSNSGASTIDGQYWYIDDVKVELAN